MAFIASFYRPCPDCGMLLGKGKGKYGLGRHHCQRGTSSMSEKVDRAYHCRLCNRVVSKAVYDGEQHCVCYSEPKNPCLEYGQQPDLLTGRKADTGKPRWDLLPESIENVVKVLTWGAEVKYAPDNWRKVDEPRRRYYAAAMRHAWKWWRGEKLDPESGLPHLAHAVCCLLFLDALDK